MGETILDLSGKQMVEEQNKLKRELANACSDIALELGYQSISDPNDMDLTPEREKKLRYTRDLRDYFFKAVRKDGATVYVIATVSASGIRADIFSPAFFEGQTSNHDWNVDEWREILTIALNAPPYPAN